MDSNHGFVRVDELMRTSNPDIFAAGDVTGGPGFVYVAAYQAGIAAQSALAFSGTNDLEWPKSTRNSGKPWTAAQVNQLR